MKNPVLLWLLLAVTACGSPDKLSEKEREAYLGKGKEIAGATFTALSGQLRQAMESGGVPHAVRYCNLVAYPLVDSLSEVHGATIRRTTLRARNPADRPNALEEEVLQDYHRTAEANEELRPKVIRVGEEVAFFAPISTQGLCLNCHGQVGRDITEKDYELIQELYPRDEATGYRLGDLRGMWSITFRE